MLTDYEMRNELLIYWTSGVSKFDFANKIIFFSVILTFIQMFIGGFFSPLSQYKGRVFLKESNIDFFTSLIKEGKFINAVDGLTIFIKSKNNDGTFSNIFIDDSSKTVSKIVHAKNGLIIENDKKKIFKLYSGQVINKDDAKINVFEFDEIDFNLADYSSNTILSPKIQEMPSTLLLSCKIKYFVNLRENKQYNFKCQKDLINDVNQELLKRFYKPLYIPIITLICCFLIIFPKNNVFYKRNQKIIFFITFMLIVLSEASLRYSTISNLTTLIYLTTPWIIFIFSYLIFYRRIKYA